MTTSDEPIQPVSPATPVSASGAPGEGPPITPVPPGGAPPVAPKPRRRRRWPYVLLALLVLLLLLVALLPTIASSGVVRGMVLKKVDDNLNGKLEVADWSFSWSGNLRADGVKLTDAEGRQILQVPHLSGRVKIWDAIHGRYDLGKFVVDGLDFWAVRDTDGKLNFEKLAKQPAASPSKPAPPEPTKKTEPEKSEPKTAEKPSKLPEVLRVELVLQNCRGTFDDLQTKQTIKLDSLNGDVKITDVNQPIETTLELIAHANESAPGKLTVAGTALMVKDNVLLAGLDEILRYADVNEKVALSGLDLATVAVAMPPTSPLHDMTGKTNGSVNVLLKPGSSAAITAGVQSDAFKVGTLAGNTLALATDMTYDGKNFSVDSKTSIGALDQNASTGGPAHVLKNFVLSVQSAGSLLQTPTTTNAVVTKLDVSDNQGIFSLKKEGDGNIQLATNSDGGLFPTGKLRLDAALQKLNQLLQDISPNDPNAPPSEAVRLRSGKLGATFAFSPGPQQTILSSNQLDITELSGGPHDVLKDEKLSLGLDASAKSDFSALNIGRLDVVGSMLTAQVSQTSIQLTSGGKNATKTPLLLMVRSAKATVNIPSLPKVKAMLDSLSAKPATIAAARLDPPLLEAMLAAAGKKGAAAALTSAPATKPVTAPPPVKVDITGGSLNVAMDVSNDGKRVTIVPNITARDLAFTAAKDVPVNPKAPEGAKKRQQVDHAVGTVDFVSSVTILPEDVAPAAKGAPEPSILEQIRELQISQLAAHLAGTEVSLSRPITLTDIDEIAKAFSSSSSAPATRPAAGQPAEAPATTQVSVDAGLSIKGDLAPLAQLAESLAAEPAGTKYPYTGAFVFNQNLAAQRGGFAAKGDGAITNFQVHDAETKAVSFTEPTIHLTNDVTMDPSAVRISALSLAMEGTKAFSIAMKGGVSDLKAKRNFDNLSADLTYDLAALWKVVYPMLSKEDQADFKDAQVTGQFTKHFTVTGAYPADVPFNEAMKSISMSGGLTVASFKGTGIELTNLDLPIFAKNGVFYVARSDKPGDYPDPAPLNGGHLGLIGSVLDLTDPHPRLTMVAGTHLLDNVSLTPALAARLGEKARNFLFSDAKEASGLITVAVTKCQRLPLDDLMTKPDPANDGELEMNVSIKNLSLSSGPLTKMFSQATPVLQTFKWLGTNKVLSTASLRGEVQNYKITISKGVTTHDMSVGLGEQGRPLHLAGNVAMNTNQMNMQLELPWKLLGVDSPQVTALAPNGITLPVTGLVNAPQFDLGSAVQKNLLGGGGGGKANPADLLKGLPDLLGGKKKKGE